jgi:hypothetical protein
MFYAPIARRKWSSVLGVSDGQTGQEWGHNCPFVRYLATVTRFLHPLFPLIRRFGNKKGPETAPFSSTIQTRWT